MKSLILGSSLLVAAVAGPYLALADHIPDANRVARSAYRLADDAEYLAEYLGVAKDQTYDHVRERDLGYASERLHLAATRLYRAARGVAVNPADHEKFDSKDHRLEQIYRAYRIVEKEFENFRRVYQSSPFWEFDIQQLAGRVANSFRVVRTDVRGNLLNQDSEPVSDQ